MESTAFFFCSAEESIISFFSLAIESRESLVLSAPPAELLLSPKIFFPSANLSSSQLSNQIFLSVHLSSFRASRSSHRKKNPHFLSKYLSFRLENLSYRQ